MAATVNTKPPRTFNWQRIVDFLPLIIPVTVVVTYVGFYQRFLFCSIEHPCSPFTAAEIFAAVSNTDQTRVAIYVARASWTVINGVHVIACVVAIVTAIMVMRAVFSEDDKKMPWITIPLVIAAALNIALGMSLWAAGDVASPAQQLFRGTIGDAVPWINKFNRFVEAVSLTGTLSLAAAACALLWRPDPEKDLTEDQLTQRAKLLRPVLYVAAATLVIAGLRLAATHAWALSYLPPESAFGMSVASLTKGIVTSLGVAYTLFAAGMYLPAALILRERLKKLPTAKPDPDGFLASHGFPPSMVQLLPRVIALLAPLLVGPLGQLIVNITNSLGGAS